jgi:hypothetical protein
VLRRPARALQPDSDLGDIPVTCFVRDLTLAEIGRALELGLHRAEDLRAAGLITAAALHLQGESRVTQSSLLQTERIHA